MYHVTSPNKNELACKQLKLSCKRIDLASLVQEIQKGCFLFKRSHKQYL